MKFLADENIDLEIVERLREEGHTIFYVLEMAPGISDEIVLERAHREAALLLTADKDFGELVFRQSRFSRGVILLRLAGLSAEEKTQRVSVAIKTRLQELDHNFTVITPKAIRIRKLPP